MSKSNYFKILIIKKILGKRWVPFENYICDYNFWFGNVSINIIKIQSVKQLKVFQK